MSTIGAVFLAAFTLTGAPQPAVPTEAPLRITQNAAWGCHEKSDLIDLLFLGLSTSFDTKLAVLLADGRCVYFKAGENVQILETGPHGFVKVQREGASPVTYWTVRRNMN
jgi:hypothetical protein